jgi:iron complex outermembrane receptor protein
VFVGNDEFDSETVDTIELGYRFASSGAFSLDTALFYNHYDDLRSISGLAVDTSSLPAFLETQAMLSNDASGYNYGLEVAANWLPSKDLKFGLSYTYIESRFDDGQAQNTDAPEQIVSLNMNWAVSHNVDFVGTWRYVDGSQSIDQVQGLNNQLDAYQGVDLGVNWHVSPSVTVSAFGRNLFYGSHVEYLAESFAIPYRVEPTFFGQIQIRF